MKLLVCIKQVPDMASRFKVNGNGIWYDEADLAFRMNEYDEFAVEQAVRLKEQLGNEPDITVLSIGPDRVIEPIKKALAMGCDRGVHIQDSASYRKDPWQIASAIAGFSHGKNFDLIFTGMQSQDRGSAQVGAILAELLGINCVTTVVGFAIDNRVVTAKRELEGGVKGVVKFSLPALVTCHLGLNTPRYPTLPNIMKAKKKELLTFPITDFLQEKEMTVTASAYAPARKGSGILLEGDVNDVAERLYGILKDKTTVVK
ncbi:MAG TPA: electron transfer flavoprotein subunit beta/FixA family protein [Nitrospirota bacterium]|nr:electron transfer flavoprotein subunit beta/FixA family protein [Nitrospirota bacterium]